MPRMNQESISLVFSKLGESTLVEFSLNFTRQSTWFFVVAKLVFTAWSRSYCACTLTSSFHCLWTSNTFCPRYLSIRLENYKMSNSFQFDCSSLGTVILARKVIHIKMCEFHAQFRILWLFLAGHKLLYPKFLDSTEF